MSAGQQDCDLRAGSGQGGELHHQGPQLPSCHHGGLQEGEGVHRVLTITMSKNLDEMSGDEKQAKLRNSLSVFSEIFTFKDRFLWTMKQNENITEQETFDVDHDENNEESLSEIPHERLTNQHTHSEERENVENVVNNEEGDNEERIPEEGRIVADQGEMNAVDVNENIDENADKLGDEDLEDRKEDAPEDLLVIQDYIHPQIPGAHMYF